MGCVSNRQYRNISGVPEGNFQTYEAGKTVIHVTVK